jgi:tetratricopeptide (TPR) repeat protein
MRTFLFLVAVLSATAVPFTYVRAQPSSEAVARARTLFEQGQAAYTAGHFEEASRKMVEAYELTRSAELAFNAARVFERMSDYDAALRYFEIYLRASTTLSPEDRAALEARMVAIREARDRRRSQVFTAPASTDELTQEARTFFLHGVALFRRRQYQAAMEAFIAAHRFAPLPEVVYNLAVTAERLGSRQDARDYYREYLRLRPNGPERGQIEREIERLRNEE